MRTLVLLAALAAAAAAGQEPLTLCLAPAADNSPTYPLKEVPTTNREFMVVFRLREGESFTALEHVWTAVDVGDEAPPNTEIARADLALKGEASGALKFTLPRDLPVGKYRLDVSADGKPWASLEFAAVEPKATPPLAKPADLLPLSPGTRWTYSFVLEPGPGVTNLTVAGATQDADGKFRATMAVAVAGKENDLARVEMKRGETLVSEEWWSLGETGLAVTKVRGGGEPAPYDPPLPMIALPLRSPSAWDYRAKDGSFAIEYRMWGPLPVKTPGGEAPGWIVWMRLLEANAATTIERQYVPGVGVVREAHVSVAGKAMLKRLETELLPAK